MSLYTVYDTATGKILKSGICPPGMENAQAVSGQSVLVGVQGNDLTQKVSTLGGPPALAPLP